MRRPRYGWTGLWAPDWAEGVPCSLQGIVGLNGPKRSLSTPMILWFYCMITYQYPDIKNNPTECLFLPPLTGLNTNANPANRKHVAWHPTSSPGYFCYLCCLCHEVVGVGMVVKVFVVICLSAVVFLLAQPRATYPRCLCGCWSMGAFVFRGAVIWAIFFLRSRSVIWTLRSPPWCL